MAITHPRHGSWAVFVQPTDPASMLNFEDYVFFTGGDGIEPDLPEALRGQSLGCLTEPPRGLGMAPIRSGDSTRALRDGVRRGSDRYDGRTITLTVEVTNDDCPGCPGARQKVRQIQRQWGRYTGDARFSTETYLMVIWPDCHDPDLIGTEDQHWSGPYMVIGRPRGCAVTWHPSDQGRATVALRFDALDQRLMLARYEENDLGEPVFDVSHCVEVFGEGTAYSRQNLATDPLLTATVFDSADATVTETRETGSAFGPWGTGYFAFEVDAAATAGRFLMPTGLAGTDAIPVEEEYRFTVSGYWWASAAVATQTFRVTWYDDTGTELFTSQSTPFTVQPGRWERHWGAFEAPASAAYALASFSWEDADAYPVGFEGRMSNALVERDLQAESLGEVQPPGWYFDGYNFGFWAGTPHASVSTTYRTRRNLAFSPRGQTLNAWLSAGGSFTMTRVTGATDGPDRELIGVVPGTPVFSEYVRFTADAGTTDPVLLLNHALDMRSGAYHSEGAAVARAYLHIAVRTSATGLLFQGQTTSMDDAASLYAGGVSPATPIELTPGEWVSHRWTGSATQDVVSLGSAARLTNTGVLAPGDTIDVVASYVESEEFYPQDPAYRLWFDQLSDGAHPGKQDVANPQFGPAAYAWQSPDDPGNPQPVVIGGTECVFPVIHIEGPFVAPISIFLRNTGVTGQNMVYRFLRDLTDEESFFIDTKNKTLSLVGSIDYNSDLEFAGSIGPLGPGPIDVAVTFGTAESGIGSIELCWENHVTGA